MKKTRLLLARWPLSRWLLVTAVALLLGLLAVHLVAAQTGTISGTVTEPDGTTVVSGAKVEIRKASGSVFGTATSQADGRFSLGPMPAGDYILVAYPPATLPQYTRSLPQPVSVLGGAVDVGTVQLTDPSVVGTIVEPDGLTPAPGWVHVRDAGHKLVESTWAPSGTIQIGGLYAGTYVLRAWPHLGSNPDLWASASQMVTVSSGVSQTVTMTLSTADLYGRTADESGANFINEATVRLHDLGGPLRQRTKTASGGRFSFGGLLTGTYVLTMEPPWWETGLVRPDPLTVTVPITPDLGTLRFDAASKVVSGTVTTNLGGPVQGARVWAQRVDRFGRVHTDTNASGFYALNLSEGLWALTVKPLSTSVPISWVYPYPPQLVHFRHDTTDEGKTINFPVLTADAHVTGTVELQGGGVPTFTVRVEVRNDEGIGRGDTIDPADGSFDVAIPNGTYKAWVRPGSADWVGLVTAPFVVPPSSTYAFTAPLTLLPRDATITGTVTSGGSGVEGVPVSAWRTGGPGWAEATTTSSGGYVLAVSAGTWMVRPALPSSGLPYLYTGQPQEVVVPDGGTVPDVDFSLLATDAHLQGTLVDEQGSPVTDATGWAGARDTVSPTIRSAAPIEDGAFDVNVPGGATYGTGVRLPADSDYIAGPPQTVSVGLSQTVQVTITLKDKNARIAGALWDRRNQVVVPGVDTEVFAWNNWAWLNTAVNPGNGVYTLSVSAGLWALDYRVDPTANYVALRDRRNVPVQEGQTFPAPLPVAERDASLGGTVLDPEGAALPGARVVADGIGPEISEVRVNTTSGNDGSFSLGLPHGWYNVRATLGPESGYINPATGRVRLAAGQTITDVTLQFRRPDAVISGTLSLSGGGGSGQVLLWAWSADDGYTKATAYLTETYSLNVISNTTWHVGAVYQDGAQYWITRTVVTLGTGGTEQDLVLDGPNALPAPVVVTFDASTEQYVELADGTSVYIPAGAMPISGTVTLHIVPIATLPHQRHANVFRYGYAFTASDEDGQPITENFNQNVVISFEYTEQELIDAGIEESELKPAYFSTTTSQWTFPQSYVVDTTDNQVAMQIDHFTDFALTTEGSETHTVYLPTIMKNAP